MFKLLKKIKEVIRDFYINGKNDKLKAEIRKEVWGIKREAQSLYDEIDAVLYAYASRCNDIFGMIKYSRLGEHEKSALTELCDLLYKDSKKQLEHMQEYIVSLN